jgi:hypothetical protein
MHGGRLSYIVADHAQYVTEAVHHPREAARGADRRYKIRIVAAYGGYLLFLLHHHMGSGLGAFG